MKSVTSGDRISANVHQVNMHNRQATFAQAPYPGLLGGVLPMAPTNQLAMLSDYIAPDQRFVTCPNQDVVYGAGFMDLGKEPAVLQVPDFGDRSGFTR